MLTLRFIGAIVALTCSALLFVAWNSGLPTNTDGWMAAIMFTGFMLVCIVAGLSWTFSRR